MPDPRIHVVIPTHTTRHLGPCIAALARQTMPPASAVVTCDTDDNAIGKVLTSVWPKVAHAWPAPPPLLWTRRPHTDGARLNQVRNNGLRALDAEGLLRDEDLVLIVDGDTLLEERAIELHASAAKAADVVVAYRINLDEPRTAGVTEDWLLAGGAQLRDLARPEELVALAARERRYRRQMDVRAAAPDWLGGVLVKRHKPKVLGGHHAVRVRCLREVNGYDEHFRGDGTDDDDLSRRLYQLRPRPRIAIEVTRILAFHLYHPTRRPWRPTEAPDHARFARDDAPTEAESGWRTPREQEKPVTTRISPG